MNRRPVGSVLPQHPIGHALRALTRWAVAASLGTVACAAQQELPQAIGADPGPPSAGQGGAGVSSTSARSTSSAMSSAGTGGSSGTSDAGGMSDAGGAGAGGAGGAGAGADDWRAVTCAMHQVDLFATPIMPARQVDYAAAFLSSAAGIGMAGAYPASVQAVGASGMPCSAASDRDACNAALGMLSGPDTRCLNDKVCAPFVVTTEGNAAQRIDTEQDLLKWLGNIDSASEAVFVAVFKGLTPACDAGQALPFMMGRGTMVLEQADGYLVRSEWMKCDAPPMRETVKIARDGSSGPLERVETGRQTCSSGRRPAGLQLTAAKSIQRDAVGAFLAQAASLEAASVHAFQHLARELFEHAAPAELIAWAARSALDEVRHTQLMAAEAQRYGATPEAPQIVQQGVRSLFEIALENAVEGCIRETYGALVAHQQATLARDPQLARVMSSIAHDETSHAELSWRIAAWIEPQLDDCARAQLDSARRSALAALFEAANTATMPALAALTLGYPSPELEHATLSNLRDSLAALERL